MDNSVIRFARYLQANLDFDSGAYKHHLQSILREKAVFDSVAYVEQYLSEVLVFKSREQIWNYSIKQISLKDKNTCLEFGVYKGLSINYFSDKLPQVSFFGFDSFEGFRENWLGHHTMKGSFNVNGALPPVNSNVTLIKGWFDETLPNFIVEQLSDIDVKFLHIDGDTYEAAVIVLRELKELIKPGLLILLGLRGLVWV